MADFPVRAPRARKVRNLHLTVSHLLTGVATTWSPPIGGTLNFTAENADGNLSIDAEDRKVSVLVAQGIADGDNQDITLVAQNPDGSPKAKINVRLTGKIIEATEPAKTTISLIPGDGEVEVIVVNGADNGAAITHHRIYTGPAADELVGSAPVVASTSHIVPAANGEEIFIAVAAINDVGEGPLSDVKSTTPVAVEDPEIELPEAVINQLAKTISLTSTPEGGVTYTVWTIDNTLVGTLNSGNSHTISISSTAALPVRVRATDGVATIWSSYYLLDQVGLFSLGDFAGFADNADFTETVFNGATPFTRNPSNGDTLGGAKLDGGILKLFKKTPTFSYAVAADGEQPTRAKMAFWGRVGIQSTTDGNANYRNVNINVGGANGTYLNLRFQQGQWYLTVRKTGGGGATTSGAWTSVLTDGDFILLMPVWSEDGTALYYQLYIEENAQLKPQISGRGFLIPSVDAANMTGTGFTLGNDLNNNSSALSLAAGWRWWYAIGARGMTSAAYSLNSATFAAPDMATPARVNWRAWYRGIRAETCAALFDVHTGSMLSDFQTVANAGAGDTGTHTIGFDPAKSGGRNIALATYDPADPAGTFSVMALGYAPHFPVMPTQQFFGNQPAPSLGEYVFEDVRRLSGHNYQYYAGNTALPTSTYPIDTTAVFSEAALLAGADNIRGSLLPGTRPVPYGMGGAWEGYSVNLDPDYFPMEITYAGGGASVVGTGWNAATGRLEFNVTAEQSANVQIKIKRNPGWESHLPSAPFQVNGGRVGFDPTKLFNDAFVADYGAATGRSCIRFGQWTNAINGRPSFTSEFPFVRMNTAVASDPALVSEACAQLNQFPMYNLKPLETNQRYIDWAYEFLTRLQAHESNPAVPSNKKWLGRYVIGIDNENWNTGAGYFEQAITTIKTAMEAGFFAAFPDGRSDLILDYDRDYLRYNSPNLQGDLPSGAIVYGGVRQQSPLADSFNVIIVNISGETIPAGTPVPATLNVGASANGMQVVAIWDTIQLAINRWRAWMIGVLGDIFKHGTSLQANKGQVVATPELDNPAVALGEDRCWTWYQSAITQDYNYVWDVLGYGGAGNELARKIDGCGPAWYAAFQGTVEASPTAGTWQAYVTANDFAAAKPGFMVNRNNAAYGSANGSNIYGAGGSIRLIRDQYHGFIRLCGTNGIPASLRPRLFFYEGGPCHTDVDCGGGITQATKFYNFFRYMDQDPEWRTWQTLYYERVRQLGPTIMMAYSHYTAGPPVNIKFQDFATLDYPGAHLGVNAAYQSRYFAEQDFLSAAGMILD